MQPIYLIRHGETELNATRVVQVPDTPLSAHGLGQAEALGARLASGALPPPARIVASDYLRARETAEAVARATGVALSFEELLRERNFGDFRGKAYADLSEDIFSAEMAPPGGESWAVFHERVERAWAAVCQLASESPGPLAVVTHGLVCFSVFERCLHGASLPDDFDARRFGNTSLSIIRGPAPWGLDLIACRAHLSGTSLA